jgi:Glycosyltransferase family 92
MAPPTPLNIDIPLTDLPRCTDGNGIAGRILGPFLPMKTPLGTKIPLLLVGNVTWLQACASRATELEFVDSRHARVGSVTACKHEVETIGIHEEKYTYTRVLCAAPELGTLEQATAMRLLVAEHVCTAAPLDARAALYLQQLEGGHGNADSMSQKEREGSLGPRNESLTETPAGPHGEAPPGWPLTVPPKYRTGVCLGPVTFRGGDPAYFLQWFAYHVDVLQIDHVYVYLVDTCGSAPLQAAVLAHYQRRGKATVIDWSTVGGTPDAAKGWWYNQPAKDNDCLHRFRYDAGYLMYFDGDEFLYPQGSLYTVPDVVKAWEELPAFPYQHSLRW